MTPPQISVVMTAWNREAYIRQAIRSALAQTVRDFELIVVDDGSTDATSAVVESMADPRVRLIRCAHEGRRRALNTGLAGARGAHVAFLDGDDLWHPRFLESMCAALGPSAPHVGMAYSAYRLFLDGNPPWDASQWLPHRPPVPGGSILRPLLRFNFISQIAVLITRACLDAVGGFEGADSGYSGDWDLWLRIAERYEIRAVHEVLAVARVHGDNMSHDQVAQRRADLAVLESARRRAGSVQAQALGLPRSIAHHRAALAWQLLERGHWEDARREARRSLAHAGWLGRAFGLSVLAAARGSFAQRPIRVVLAAALRIRNPFSWGRRTLPPTPAPGREVSVAVVAHNAARDLNACLASIRAQTHAPFEIVVIDNGSADDTAAIARATPGVRVVPAGRNIGFAGGANAAFRETQGSWLALVNQDARLDDDFLERALAAAARAEEAGLRIGAVQGKVLMTPASDPNNQAGTRIDALGIELRRSRRNLILGHGAPEASAVDGEVFGPDGAAALFRRAALEDCAVDGDPFDPDFFAYREDADLAWRAQRRGWRTVVASDAVAYHRRTLTSRTRRTIAPALRRASVRNRYLVLLKNERIADFARDLPWIAAFEAVFLLNLAVRDPRALLGLVDACRLAPRALRRRRAFFARPPVDPAAPRRFFGLKAPLPVAADPPAAPFAG